MSDVTKINEIMLSPDCCPNGLMDVILSVSVMGDDKNVDDDYECFEISNWAKGTKIECCYLENKMCPLYLKILERVKPKTRTWSDAFASQNR